MHLTTESYSRGVSFTVSDVLSLTATFRSPAGDESIVNRVVDASGGDGQEIVNNDACSILTDVLHASSIYQLSFLSCTGDNELIDHDERSDKPAPGFPFYVWLGCVANVEVEGSGGRNEQVSGKREGSRSDSSDTGERARTTSSKRSKASRGKGKREGKVKKRCERSELVFVWRVHTRQGVGAASLGSDGPSVTLVGYDRVEHLYPAHYDFFTNRYHDQLLAFQSSAGQDGVNTVLLGIPPRDAGQPVLTHLTQCVLPGYHSVNCGWSGDGGYMALVGHDDPELRVVKVDITREKPSEGISDISCQELVQESRDKVLSNVFHLWCEDDPTLLQPLDYENEKQLAEDYESKGVDTETLTQQLIEFHRELHPPGGTGEATECEDQDLAAWALDNHFESLDNYFQFDAYPQEGEIILRFTFRYYPFDCVQCVVSPYQF